MNDYYNQEEISFPIALIYSNDVLLAHLRQVLIESGLSVVYEMSLATFNCAAIHQSGAKTVLVHLGGQVDEESMEFENLLDDDSLQVIFNDSTVYKTLQGCDHDRWLRHLLAKIGRNKNIHPPIPLESELLPEVIKSMDAVAQLYGQENPLEISAQDHEEIPDFLGEIDSSSTVGEFEQNTSQTGTNSTADLLLTGDFAQTLNDFGLNNVDFMHQKQQDQVASAAPVQGEYEGLDALLADMQEDTNEIASCSHEEKLESVIQDFHQINMSELSLLPLEGEDNALNLSQPFFTQAATSMRKTAVGTSFDSVNDVKPQDGKKESDHASLDIFSGGQEFQVAKDADLNSLEVWIIGASMGGPDALMEFLSALSVDAKQTFIIVQHMDIDFFSALNKQLARSTNLPILSLKARERLKSGAVYIMPPHFQLQFNRQEVILLPEVENNGYSPSIDQVAGCMASHIGQKANLIICSGMSQDGLQAAEIITKAGGKVWGQDPSSCVMSSMVDAVHELGMISFFGEPADLALHMRVI